MHEFDNDLSQIAELQDIFSISTRTNLRRFINYDPAIAWWSLHKEKEDDWGVLKQHEQKQIETTLRERYGTGINTFIYAADRDGDFVNTLVPTEKFKTVLKRGIAYRKDIGSLEHEREEAELDGFLKINEVLQNKNTPLGTRMIVVSGPGIIEETAYEHNFVDIYEKTLDKDGSIEVKMTRFTAFDDYEEYIKKILAFDLNYFDEFEGSIDAWFLKHPVMVKPQSKYQTSEDLFSKVFNRGEVSMEEDEFQKLLSYCMPLIQNYINIICSDEFDPQQIALAFNAVLNKADKFIYNREEKINYSSVYEESIVLGIQIVRSVSAGCSMSIGFGTDKFGNSVAKFGLGGEKYVKNCGNCGAVIEAHISKGYVCKNCSGVYEGC